MDEKTIIDRYQESTKNLASRRHAVNSLRHLAMDKICFNTSDVRQYLQLYREVMLNVAEQYPFLQNEVQRQLDKKERSRSRS
jgi:hypothetical protein